MVEERVAATAGRARIDIWPGAFFAAVIVASVVILALLAIVIALSFRIGSLGASDAAWSLANYPAIFLDAFTYRVLANTIGFAVTSLLVALFFGVIEHGSSVCFVPPMLQPETVDFLVSRVVK